MSEKGSRGVCALQSHFTCKALEGFSPFFSLPFSALPIAGPTPCLPHIKGIDRKDRTAELHALCLCHSGLQRQSCKLGTRESPALPSAALIPGASQPCPVFLYFSNLCLRPFHRWPGSSPRVSLGPLRQLADSTFLSSIRSLELNLTPLL